MTNSPSVSESLQLAAKYFKANRLIQAEQFYRQVLKEQPQHPEALYGLGLLAQQMNQLPIAEKLLSKVVSLRPDLLKAWFSLGNVRQANGQLPKAELAYQKAIELQPNIAPLYNNLGYTLQEQGKWDEAIKSYKKALEIQPNCIEAEVNLANALFAQEKLPLDKQSHYAAANNNLGLNSIKAKDFQAAEAYYRQAIAMQPNLAEAHYNLAVVLKEQDKLQEAVDCYSKALTLKPEYVEAYKNLGDALQQQDKLEEAADAYRKALKLKPDYAQAYSNLLSVLNKLKSTSIWQRFSKIRQVSGIKGALSDVWKLFWMRFAGLSLLGRIATWLATWFAPPYWGRAHLSYYHSQGYVSPKADIYHQNLQFGANVFIGDRVTIYNDRNGGKVELGDRVHLYGDTCIQTGKEGTVKIGADTHIQPRCQLSAYKAPINIGCNVLIATNCAFYPYDHSMIPGQFIHLQPLKTRGGITVDDGAWLGCGVIVLSGVRIGKGAVIGAGSVVNQDIPDGAIAVGSPAKVVKMRADLVGKKESGKQLSVKAWFDLGNSHQAKNQLKEATEAYQKAIALKPDFVEAHYRLGMMLQEQGELEAARDCYQKVLEINPRFADAYFNLAKIHQQQNNLQEAISAYRQGLKASNPDYASAITTQGCNKQQETQITPPVSEEEVIVGEHPFPSIPQVSNPTNERPFWSVVLPIYSTDKRSDYLLECLVSVLRQWKEDMEIIVVDDASPLCIKDLISEIGGGIIQYYRNSQNRGAYKNFNTAVAISRGHWIHLLHDDDYVLPGFYKRLQESLENTSSSVGAAFTGYENVNEQGQVIFSQQLYKQERGIAKDFVERIGIANPLNMPAVVVRRSTYEHLGGYLPELNYTGDWEFYKRVSAFYDLWYEPEILARYRQHSQNITTDSTLSGSKGTDIRRAIEVSENYLLDEITVKSRHYHFAWCLNNAIIPLKAGKISGALLLIQEALKIDNSPQSVTKLFSWLKQDDLSALRDELISRLLVKGLKV
ncbi:acetyltransferase (isoleucine patch superfamily) [Rivularia sp. PCC 7116]|uniref:tetratricopeptide repeat protein n=1 Tax=Rivularia sp. PCC 7116 TaxID=373994 RepID=UPI00029F100E|nr:tetratricopeptide repeat protein [Rivularia sp. PCC 7116]AFY52977.1 acetyltransferase (isoleucine patch superfamily) [Rivularia sp. PCC 7116]